MLWFVLNLTVYTTSASDVFRPRDIEWNVRGSWILRTPDKCMRLELYEVNVMLVQPMQFMHAAKIFYLLQVILFLMLLCNWYSTFSGCFNKHILPSLT